MRTIDLDNGPIRYPGALDWDRSEQGISPRRLPAWTRPQVPDVADQVVRMPSGVRLEFSTDSATIELDVMTTRFHFDGLTYPPMTFDLLVDDALVAARRAGVDVLNLGLGGSCQLDPYVARTMRDAPADLLSLKVGINIVNAASLGERTFAPALHGFLDTIREGQPDTPFLVISPIICPSHEDTPGPTVYGGNGRFTSVAGHEEIRADSLTLSRIRQIVAQVIGQRRDGGDVNLHYLNGLELFGGEDVADLPDDLHPSGDGYVRMGERFFDKVFSGSGVFAA